MTAAWLEHPPVNPPPGMSAFAAEHPLAARILARRGINTESAVRAYIDPDAYPSASPFSLPGMQAAVERLLLSIRKAEKIAVWGDFDVDGQTAAAILVGTLRRLGAEVTYRLPLGGREAHGINLNGVKDLIQDGARLILTCDTGINALEETVYAASQDVDVIISDHHSLPAELPPAAAILNTHLLPEGHPMESLPGAGVAYQLARALFEAARPNTPPPAWDDLTALAIVADMAPIRGDTRALLQRGIRSLRQASRPGLAMLMELTGVDPAGLNEDTIAYTLAPRLNAPGRLSDANPLVEFYLSEDEAFLRPLVHEMEALSARRRLLAEEVFQAALLQLRPENALRDLPALIVTGTDWPGSVLGTVANRLTEAYHKPALVISLNARSGIGRGSARAPQGVDVTAALAEQAAHLERFGGHAGAAGFSLRAESLEEFKRDFFRTLIALPSPPADVLEIEGTLALGDLSLELARQVEMLAPFGAGCPQPVFTSRNLVLSERAAIGKNGEHARLVVQDGRGERREALWWQGAGSSLPQAPFDLAYTLRVTTLKGKPAVQMVYVDARRSPEGAPERGELLHEERKIRDLRRDPDPPARLQEARRADPDILIWAEGPQAPTLDGLGLNRSELRPGRTLLIWTAPPSAEIYRQALETVQPQAVWLLAVTDEEIDSPEGFLRRLAGLVKYALRSGEGKTSPDMLAASAGGRGEAVQAGLAWLAAHGDILYTVENENLGEIRIQVPGTPAGADEIQAAWEKLRSDLEETRAYRAFFRRAEPEALE